jgi:hypothetical protein
MCVMLLFCGVLCMIVAGANSEEPHMLIMEFMANGDLSHYLVDQRLVRISLLPQYGFHFLPSSQCVHAHAHTIAAIASTLLTNRAYYAHMRVSFTSTFCLCLHDLFRSLFSRLVLWLSQGQGGQRHRI